MVFVGQFDVWKVWSFFYQLVFVEVVFDEVVRVVENGRLFGLVDDFGLFYLDLSRVYVIWFVEYLCLGKMGYQIVNKMGVVESLVNVVISKVVSRLGVKCC